MTFLSTEMIPFGVQNCPRVLEVVHSKFEQAQINSPLFDWSGKQWKKELSSLEFPVSTENLILISILVFIYIRTLLQEWTDIPFS